MSDDRLAKGLSSTMPATERSLSAYIRLRGGGREGERGREREGGRGGERGREEREREGGKERER